jgi:hypothetical protein
MGMDWILDLLTPYAHHSGLYVMYNATANLHNSIINSRSLVTASNSGDCAASRAQVLSSPTPVQNRLPAIPPIELAHFLFLVPLAELTGTQHFPSDELPTLNSVFRFLS